MSCFWFYFVLLCIVVNGMTGLEREMEINDKLYPILKSKIKNDKLNGKTVTAKKETVCITTRDGICLSTNIWFPDPLIWGNGPYNVYFADTPYGKSTLDATGDVVNAEGWVFMGQDQRGRKASTGNYSFWRTQGNDTLDTIEYINAQNWSTGKIEVIGVSANCLAQYADIIGVTIYPVNSNEWNRYYPEYQQIVFAQLFLGNGMGYQLTYQGGAYRNGLVTNWLDHLGEGSYVQTLLENEDFTEEYWKYLAGPLGNQWYWANISALHFAGWYDIFGNYQIETAMYLNKSGLPHAKGNQILIVDPGGHCPIGDIIWVDDLRGWEIVELYALPASRAAFKVDNVEDFNIHDYFPHNVWFYVLGPSIEEEGLYWIEADGFPEYTYQYYYINDNNVISTSKQTTSNSQTYLYDPMNPVKTWGGNNLEIEPCGPQNQNVVEKGRTDVLQYNSSVITENFAIVGPIWVNLFVSSDAVDTDFVVKIIDVFPNGKRMLVQDGIYRMRWRNAQPYFPDYYSFNYNQATKPTLMNKNEIYNISVQVGHMSYIFNKNHKIGLSITSSNYPRFSVNYNSGNNVIDNSTGYTTANNVIHYGGNYPSNIALPIVDLNWLQNNKVNWDEFDKKKQALYK